VIDPGGEPRTPWPERLGVFVATCGYLGYVPVAPGTFGSLAGLVVLAAIRATGSAQIEFGVIALLFAVGVWGSGVAERHFARTDPGCVVIDEVVGMLLTVAFLPVGVWGAAVAFLVFRVFDIIKPWPARQFERLHGGLGIMADDVMAAVYGNLVVRGLLLVAPVWLT
jgi:phosphatidylglycerophosphatase A